MIVSEIVGPEIQRGGFYSGHPTIYLHLFGCNLRCQRYGTNDLLPAAPNPEIIQTLADAVLYRNKTDVPQLSSGCSAYHRVYSEFGHLAQSESVDSVVEQVLAKTYNHLENNWKRKQPVLVISGGEPLLSEHQNDLVLFLSHHKIRDTFTQIVFETNGTLNLSQKFQQILRNCFHIEWTFLVSPKLECSGHSKTVTLVPEALQTYGGKSARICLRFNVDFKHYQYDRKRVEQEILYFIRAYRLCDIDIDQVFVSPIGHTHTPQYDINFLHVRELCCQTGLLFWE